MSNVILSNGIRQNLLSLQQTARQQGEIQNRLATGRKVNTAVDNRSTSSPPPPSTTAPPS
jgi:flagellin-like hook-associated protein FlgL